ncbi:hypothetical protein [Litoribacillus peritrichatus]|uniref:Uncharacterized protein n=1 Tax=Litoribacillus peritrichatus TaxID=718191 RepID=A0ABP7N1D6_9GAMM
MSYGLSMKSEWSDFTQPDQCSLSLFNEVMRREPGRFFHPVAVQFKSRNKRFLRFLCHKVLLNSADHFQLQWVSIQLTASGTPTLVDVNDVITEVSACDVFVPATLVSAHITLANEGVVLSGVIDAYDYFSYDHKIIPKNNTTGQIAADVDYWPYHAVLEETGIGYNPGKGPVAKPTSFSLLLNPTQIGKKGIKLIAKGQEVLLDLADLKNPALGACDASSHLLLQKAFITNGRASSSDDVSGFDQVTLYDDKCYQFYEDKEGQGASQAILTYRPPGLKAIKQCRLNYKQAIEAFSVATKGAMFISLTLYQPDTADMNEPIWEFETICNEKLLIGANSGRVRYATSSSPLAKRMKAS